MSTALPTPPDFQTGSHPFGRAKAFTVTADGQWLYDGNGGSIAFIKMKDSVTGPYIDDYLKLPDGNKRLPVGQQSVVPSRMILDTLHGEDRLYIAAGRDGLWAMDADPLSTSNRAWRIDDSGNTNPVNQLSKRWCGDVEIETVDGEDYLIAIFGKRASSVLRIYKLDDVRAVASPSNSELGHEIAALVQIPLGTNSEYTPPSNASYGRSTSMAMDCVVEGELGSQKLVAFVAMGHHGLVQVSFDPGPGSTFSTAKAWGPVFGTGSHYADGNGLVPFVDAITYTNSVYTEDRDFFDPLDVPIQREEAPVFTDVKVFRGALGGQTVYQVYAAVDHLFWCMFDLDYATGSGWSQFMPIAHHEGVPVTFTDTGVYAGGTKQAMLAVSDSLGKVMAYGRSLEILHHESSGEHYLLVGCPNLPFVKQFLAYTYEGITFGSDFSQGTTDDNHRSASGPGVTTGVFIYEMKPAYTALPDDSPTQTPSNLLTWSYPAGGDNLFAPPLQNEPGELAIFHNMTANFENAMGMTKARLGLCLSLVDLSNVYTGSQLPDEADVLLRDPKEGHMDGGFVTFSARPALADPRLILTATNDDPQKRDSWLEIGDRDLVTGFRDVTPLGLNAVGPVDLDYKIHAGPNGLLLSEDSQWFSPGAQGDQLLFFGGSNQLDPDLNAPYPDEPGRWTLMDLKVTSGGNLDPQVLRHWHILPKPDRFNYVPRLSFQAGSSMGQEFDQALGPVLAPQQGYVFLSQVFTAEGITALPRAKVEEILAGTSSDPWQVGDDLFIGTDEPLKLNVDEIRLVTHPEFNNMKNGDEVADGLPYANLEAYWATKDNQVAGDDHRGRTFTWTPTVMRVASPGTNQLDRWLLAVPAGQVVADEDWRVYQDVNQGDNNSRFLPEQLYLDNDRRAMVRFWEIAPVTGEYKIVTQKFAGQNGDVFGNSPLPTWFGNNSDRHAWAVRSVTLQDEGGDDRVFSLVVDYSGGLEAIEVTDILGLVDFANTDRSLVLAAAGSGLRVGPVTNGTWNSPPPTHDGSSALVWDAAVSHVSGSSKALVYVPVRRGGIVVLEFAPFETVVFKQVSRLSVPVFATSVSVLPGGTAGSESLLVSSYGGGIRVFDRK